MFHESVTVGTERYRDIKGCSIAKSLLNAVAHVMTVVLGFYYGNGDIRLVVEDKIGPLAATTSRASAAHVDATIGERDLLAYLTLNIPPGLFQGRHNELGADIAF